MNAIHAEVTGFVQGVGFRYATVRLARRLGLAGWVRNLASGGVEVWAQGPDGAVAELSAFLEKGPRGAAVTSVHLDAVDADLGLSGFDVRY